MSWTDKKALEIINNIRDKFNIKLFIETGTFKAINAIVQSENFDYVFTCENHPDYLKIVESKVNDIYNIYAFDAHSPVFLKNIKPIIDKQKEPVFIYLDAHFYNPDIPKEKRFVVLDELDSLINTSNCIICIHDFWNGKYTGITYDGIKLDLDLVKEKLLKINPKFKFYSNNKCDVYNITNITELINDADANDNIIYANSTEQKRDRGMLYAIPEEVEIDGIELIW